MSEEIIGFMTGETLPEGYVIEKNHGIVHYHFKKMLSHNIRKDKINIETMEIDAAMNEMSKLVPEDTTAIINIQLTTAVSNYKEGQFLECVLMGTAVKTKKK